MTLKDFIAALQVPSFIILIWGFLETLLLEWWPAYQKIEDPRWKRAGAIGVAFTVPVLGILLNWGFYGVVPNVDIIWGALLAGFTVAFPASHVMHMAFMKGKKRYPTPTGGPSFDAHCTGGAPPKKSKK